MGRTVTPDPWKPGEPIGPGALYLPTRQIAEAYHAECQRQVVAAVARAICAIPDLETRRARVAMYPATLREQLKTAVAAYWKEHRL